MDDLDDKISLDGAIDTIDSCSGFSDDTSIVGEAWSFIKEFIESRRDKCPGCRSNLRDNKCYNGNCIFGPFDYTY